MNKKVVLSVLSTAVVASLATSAFAAPSAGLYIGGTVDKYYSLEAFVNNEEGARNEINSVGLDNVLYVDTNAKAATVKEIALADSLNDALEPAKLADFGDNVYTNATTGATYDPSKDPDLIGEPTGDLKVESVSAINAKQVEVKFNNAVDEDKLDVTKFSVKLAGATAVPFATTGATQVDAEVSADGKTVTFTFVNALTTASWGSIAQGDTFLVQVSGHEGIEDASKTVQFSDTTAPALVSATAKTAAVTKTVTLAFNEPVDFATTGVFKVGGQVATPAPGSNVREVVLTTAQTLSAGQTYSVEVTNLKDLSGNLISPNPVTLSFQVEQDNSAQAVKSVTVKGDDTVEIEFNENMEPTTIVGALTGTSNVKLVDAAANVITNASLAQKGTSKSIYTLTLAAGSNVFANSNTANLSLIITTGVKDAFGNAVAQETKSVSVTKDTVAPEVASASVVAAGNATYANGALVLKLSEEVQALVGNNLARTNISVIDQDGNDITNDLYTNATIANVERKVNDNTTVYVPFVAAPATTVESATVRLAAGVFTDDSLGANKTAAKVINGVDFGGANGGPVDTVKPVVANAVGQVTSHVNTITFDVTEANLDRTTVQNLDNYRLDGKPLPSGTYVTVTGTAPSLVVTINLPAESVSATRTNYAFTVNGIKDKAGNTAEVLAVNNVALEDNVKPVLTTATLNTDGTVSLGYSETLTIGAATGDLEVTLNGKLLDTTAVVVAPITSGAEAGKDLLTVVTAVDQGVDTNYGGGDDTLYIEVDGAAGLSAGDIVLTANGSFAAADDGGKFDLTTASSLKIATVASPTTGADAAGNTLTGEVVKVVK